MIAADLAKKGYRIAFPFGDSWDYDLLAFIDQPGIQAINRIQVKYTESTAGLIILKPRTHSVHAGVVSVTKKYTANLIDVLAAYDNTTEQCFYIPATEFGEGMSEFRLRYSNEQKNPRIRLVDNYRTPRLNQLEGVVQRLSRLPVTQKIASSNLVILVKLVHDDGGSCQFESGTGRERRKMQALTVRKAETIEP